MRRASFMLALLSALLFALAQPVAAGNIFNFSGKVAVAQWSLGDAQNTSVFVSGFEGSFQSPPGRPFQATNVFVGVSQYFCDAVQDELVFRGYSGFEPAPDALRISGTLTNASVSDASLTLFGSETRYADCANPTNPTFNNLGPFVVALSANWTGNGQLVRTRSTSSFDAGPDCKFFFRFDGTSRQATATGSITGQLNLGALGTTGFANMVSTRNSTLQIGNGC